MIEVFRTSMEALDQVEYNRFVRSPQDDGDIGQFPDSYGPKRYPKRLQGRRYGIDFSQYAGLTLHESTLYRGPGEGIKNKHA
jgi:hypothetical protein